MSSSAGEYESVAIPWLTAEEQAAWQNYRLMSRLVEAAIGKGLLRASLSTQDYDVLSSLTALEGGRCNAKPLATHLQWSPSRLSHHIDRMERRGLVRRDPSQPGRSFELVITSDGRSAIELAAPAHVSLVRQLFIEQLSPEDLRTLNDVAARVVAAVAAAEPPPSRTNELHRFPVAECPHACDPRHPCAETMSGVQ